MSVNGLWCLGTCSAFILVAAGCGSGATVVGGIDKVERVEISGARASLQVGEEVSLSALAYAGSTKLDGATFSWSTSSTAIATVTAGGRVRGVASGQVEIRATSDGVTAAVSMQVLGAQAPVVTNNNFQLVALGVCSGLGPQWSRATAHGLRATDVNGDILLADEAVQEEYRFNYADGTFDNWATFTFPVSWTFVGTGYAVDVARNNITCWGPGGTVGVELRTRVKDTTGRWSEWVVARVSF